MKVTLKDGSSKEYASAMSIYDIAMDISEGLARVAVAGEVDGEVNVQYTEMIPCRMGLELLQTLTNRIKHSKLSVVDM